jgi:hypothetical protein
MTFRVNISLRFLFEESKITKEFDLLVKQAAVIQIPLVLGKPFAKFFSTSFVGNEIMCLIRVK